MWARPHAEPADSRIQAMSRQSSALRTDAHLFFAGAVDEANRAPTTSRP